MLRRDFATTVRWGAIGAVPFGLVISLLNTHGARYLYYFGRAAAVWMCLLLLTASVEVLLRPKSRAGWARFFAAAGCGAADGLFSAQWVPLSLGDASPIRVGLQVTLLWMLGSAWIRAMASIDRDNPPWRRLESRKSAVSRIEAATAEG